MALSRSWVLLVNSAGRSQPAPLNINALGRRAKSAQKSSIRGQCDNAGLTDRAVDMFDRLIGAISRKAEGRHARAFQGDANAINEKVRLYARIGAALIAAHEAKQDAFSAIAT